MVKEGQRSSYLPMSGDATFGEGGSARDLGGIGSLVGAHRDRYVGAVRFVGATLTGIVAGILLASSMQVGVVRVPGITISPSCRLKT
jgi:hypothetical protein